MFAIAGETLYITIDQKPKRDQSKPLQRLRNIALNPSVAVVVDHYEEDWTQLGWVMLRGDAQVLHSGVEHDDAQMLLRSRYPQYRRCSSSLCRSLPSGSRVPLGGETGLSPIDASEICTVVPVKNLANAKQRLSPLLNEQERYRLFRAMLEDVLNVLVKTTMLARVVLVTRDEEVLSLAGKFDVDTWSSPRISDKPKPSTLR